MGGLSTDRFKTVQTSDTAVEGNVSRMVSDWETLPRAWEWIIQCGFKPLTNLTILFQQIFPQPNTLEGE